MLTPTRHARLVLLPLLLLIAWPPTTSAAAPDAIEKPLLWRIERDPPVYLFGTIHLPDKRVLELPDVVFEAVDSVDAVYAELKFDSSLDVKLMKAAKLPDGQRLKKVLPRKLYDRTDAYMTSKGIPLASFDQFHVWFVSTQIGMLDYMEEFATIEPLDKMLYSRAERAGQRVGGIETLDEQIDALGTLNQDEQIEMLGDTLDDLEADAQAGKDSMQELVTAYLKGDLDGLIAQQNEHLDLSNPTHKKFYDALIEHRNIRMAERIDKLLTKRKANSFFFAIGALHYPGEKGIITLLEKEGYDIRRLGKDDAGKLPSGQREKEPVGTP